METVLLVALWLFIVTNLDTVVVIGAFCADGAYRPWEVFLGHYVGFCIGLAGAVIAGVVAAELLREWTFLLGFVPLGVGVWSLVRPPADAAGPPPAASSPAGRVAVIAAAGVGISGENVAVYVPFFADLSSAALALVVGLYLVGAGVVFLVAYATVSRVAADGIPESLERWLVPAVLIGVGVYVIVTGWLVG